MNWKADLSWHCPSKHIHMPSPHGNIRMVRFPTEVQGKVPKKDTPRNPSKSYWASYYLGWAALECYVYCILQLMEVTKASPDSKKGNQVSSLNGGLAKKIVPTFNLPHKDRGMVLKLKIYRYMKPNIMNIELLSILPSLDSYNTGNQDEEFEIFFSGEE